MSEWPYDYTFEDQRVLIPRVSVAPTIEPITTAEAKTHLRVDTSTEDTYIGTLITAARERAETILNRSFITTTWVVKMQRFPEARGIIRLPRPRLITVSSITYTDTSQQSQTLSSSTYTVDVQSEPGTIQPAYTQWWPTALDHVNSVTVTYTAGYGASAATVPVAIKQALLLMVAHMFENRVPINVGNIVTDFPMSVQWLLDTERWTPL